ncbi:MAG: PDZ domain-containing protein [Phycisphaerales bacterium]
MSTRTLLTTTVSLALCASAHTSADTPAEVSKLVDSLRADAVAQREAAATALADRPDLELPQIGEILRRNDLTPEQRLRLENIARNKFIRSPRGALGVRFADLSAEAAIQQTYEKFPSSKVLKPGDVITAIEGVPMISPDGSLRPNCRPFIIAADPGDSIRVTVRRDGQTLDLDCPLGRFNDLDNGMRWAGASAFQPGDIEAAWSIRAAKLTGRSAPEPVASGVATDEWTPRGRALVEREAEQRDMSVKGAPVVAGGQPRPALRPEEITGVYDKEIQVKRFDGLRQARPDPRTVARQRELNTRITQLLIEHNTLRMRADDPKLPQAQRDTALKDANRKMEQINELSNQMMLLPR